MNFQTWMIVYTNDSDRVDVFNNINKKVTTNLFPAIDSVNEFDKYAAYGLQNDYVNEHFIAFSNEKKGKLGCNLSHQMLIEKIAKVSPYEWNLVLEDDVDIDESFFEKTDFILDAATKNNSLFIQLYSHPKFHEAQQKEAKIVDDLYSMMFQWGTCGYFIHKKAIESFCSSFPLTENIDFAYGKKIRRWKSLCWLNNGLVTIGSKDGWDNKTKIGSIIHGFSNTSCS